MQRFRLVWFPICCFFPTHWKVFVQGLGFGAMGNIEDRANLHLSAACGGAELLCPAFSLVAFPHLTDLVGIRAGTGEGRYMELC